uniref:Uncharacterized protein n=1 Tax=Arion vulgaris TaxID=1028688 RepID=A0A0B7BAR6_9EUPU
MHFLIPGKGHTGSRLDMCVLYVLYFYAACFLCASGVQRFLAIQGPLVVLQHHIW